MPHGRRRRPTLAQLAELLRTATWTPNTNGYLSTKWRFTENGERRHTNVLKHRAKVMVKLGRQLKRSEHIHHQNRDKRDNRLQNLVVLDARLHSKLTIQALDLARRMNEARWHGHTKRPRQYATAEQQREYRARHREHFRALFNAYYSAHRDHINAGRRAKYASKSPDEKRRILNAKRAWQLANPDRQLGYVKAWAKRNKAAINAKRREQRRAAKPGQQPTTSD